MIKTNKAVVLFVAMVLTAGIASAQIRISSPYSRYGLGDLKGNGLSRSLATGSTGYAFRDSLLLNIQNPASYTSFDSMTFICDVGIGSHWNNLQTMSAIQDFNNYTTLGYLTFGFPITRWMGASAGLIPYSQTGYKLLINDSLNGAGLVEHKYLGYGSLNRFYIGSGFKLHRDLSVGFNASFLFGTLNNIKSIYFKDLTYVFDTRISDVLVINDFHFEVGAQYHKRLKNKYFINAGLVYQVPWNMTGRKTFTVERFVTATTGTEVTRDTVEYKPNEHGKIHIPGGLGGGVSLGKLNYWNFNLDAAWQKWDNYTNFGVKDSLVSNLKINTGFSVTPLHSNASNYFRRMTYRAGFRYENTYLSIRGHQINEYAISVGMGFPFHRGTSINLSFEFGQRGTLKDDLIKETFVNGVLGLTIKENWFYRRKLD